MVIFILRNVGCKNLFFIEAKISSIIVYPFHLLQFVLLLLLRGASFVYHSSAIPYKGMGIILIFL